MQFSRSVFLHIEARSFIHLKSHSYLNIPSFNSCMCMCVVMVVRFNYKECFLRNYYQDLVVCKNVMGPLNSSTQKIFQSSNIDQGL